MLVLSQALKLMQLLVWLGLKVDLLCSILSLTIIRDHTGDFLPSLLYVFNSLIYWNVYTLICARVLCTEMGSNVDRIVFTESDSRFCVDITCTKDGKFVTINSNSRSSSEV